MRIFFRSILNYSPQRTQRTQSIATTIFASFALWYEKVKYISHLRLRCGSANINTELVRTRYELGLMSSFKFVLSSLLIVFFIVIYELHFIADFAVKSICYLNRLLGTNINQVSTFICVHLRLIKFSKIFRYNHIKTKGCNL
ncbi:hypothetical protein ANME2D_02379 [Candidatus Methanoperedens nitroreducens]|uniref:Uncharacterized protein n=1 Tax=Candidatus Methanoperedens nitratireducens TaxID=1392998 RepID=A0A062V787_9EURY|nr:hypothetical protein ANME2D_02379 [Candidatus Methanoperedens nitroreducens]